MKKLTLPSQSEIIYLKGIINYTEFHLENGKKEISSSTLLRHQERHTHFLRVNKSHLVNPKFVKRIHSDGPQYEVELKNGLRLNVSRRRKNILEQFQIA